MSIITGLELLREGHSVIYYAFWHDKPYRALALIVWDDKPGRSDTQMGAAGIPQFAHRIVRFYE